MLKNLSPEDRLKYKNIKTGGDETDDFDEEFINDLFYMFRDMDLKKNLEKKKSSKRWRHEKTNGFISRRWTER